MKWAYHIKDKVKAAGILAIILGVMLLSHFAVRNYFNELDHSVTSIYHDRLMPATYIFDITNHVYQKRLLAERYARTHEPALAALNKEHDRSIAAIVRSYESTFLTVGEKKEWHSFKQNLLRYQLASELAMEPQNRNGVVTMQQNPEQAFDLTLQSLSTLSKIQAGEGSQIQAHSKAILGGSIIISYLEISLLIILGGFTLVLLSVSDKAIFRLAKNTSLN